LDDAVALERGLLDPEVRRSHERVERERSLRSSLWVEGPEGWQLLFHQGTPRQPHAA
jgi:hypothetical protein